MIAQDTFQHSTLNRLRGLIASVEVRPLVRSEVLDRWLATSLLQKAIRRDAPDLAWMAASYLLENFPAYFWRRLPIIAMEDIGLGDLDTCMMVILSSRSASARVELGGCLPVATAMVEIMCTATKDRSTDDLFDIILRCPDAREDRIAMFEAQQAEEPFATDRAVAGVIGAANLMAVHAGCIGDLPTISIGKKVWADAMQRCDHFAPRMEVIETALLGLKLTGVILAPMLVLLGGHTDTQVKVTDDIMPSSPTNTAIPTWALGQHTRVGLDGFRRYISQSTKMRSLLNQAADGSVSRSKVVGGLVYRLDCGQLLHRRDCPVASGLKEQVTGLGWGTPDTAVPEMLATLCAEFDLLNACRAAALQDHLK